MAKTAYATATAMPADSAFNADGSIKQLIKIEGLKVFSHDEVTGVTIFELSGLKTRHIEWYNVLNQLNYGKGELDDREADDLCEAIGRLVTEFDIARELKGRIKLG